MHEVPIETFRKVIEVNLMGVGERLSSIRSDDEETKIRSHF